MGSRSLYVFESLTAMWRRQDKLYIKEGQKAFPISLIAYLVESVRGLCGYVEDGTADEHLVTFVVVCSAVSR
jgi:hypothetical protein